MESNLNKLTLLLIIEGFEIVRIERESMRKAMPIVRPTIRGFANWYIKIFKGDKYENYDVQATWRGMR